MADQGQGPRPALDELIQRRGAALKELGSLDESISKALHEAFSAVGRDEPAESEAVEELASRVDLLTAQMNTVIAGPRGWNACVDACRLIPNRWLRRLCFVACAALFGIPH